MPVHLHATPTIWYSVNWTYLGDETLTVAQHILRIWKFQKNVLNSCKKLWFLCNKYSNGQIRVQRLDYANLQWMILHFSRAWNIFSIMYLIFFLYKIDILGMLQKNSCYEMIQTISSSLVLKTSSPKGNDRSPESNVPRSNLISKNSNSSKL